MFDNSGVGRTQSMPGEQTGTLTIDAMADQTSVLVDTLGLSRPDVLGWPMGGMIAQANTQPLPRRRSQRKRLRLAPRPIGGTART
jgi:pimeloyl-ACP methyl ester carboxylesterase